MLGNLCLLFLLAFSWSALTENFDFMPNRELSLSLIRDVKQEPVGPKKALADEIYNLVSHNDSDCAMLKALERNEELSGESVRRLFELLGWPDNYHKNYTKLKKMSGKERLALVAYAAFIKSLTQVNKKIVITHKMKAFLTESKIPFKEDNSEPGTVTILGVEKNSGERFEYAHSLATSILLGAVGKAVRKKDSAYYLEANLFLQQLKIGKTIYKCNEQNKECWRLDAQGKVNKRKNTVQGSVTFDSGKNQTRAEYISKPSKQYESRLLSTRHELQNGELAFTSSRIKSDGEKEFVDNITLKQRNYDFMYKNEGDGNGSKKDVRLNTDQARFGFSKISNTAAGTIETDGFAHFLNKEKTKEVKVNSNSTSGNSVTYIQRNMSREQHDENINEYEKNKKYMSSSETQGATLDEIEKFTENQVTFTETRENEQRIYMSRATCIGGNLTCSTLSVSASTDQEYTGNYERTSPSGSTSFGVNHRKEEDGSYTAASLSRITDSSETSLGAVYKEKPGEDEYGASASHSRKKGDTRFTIGASQTNKSSERFASFDRATDWNNMKYGARVNYEDGATNGLVYFSMEFLPQQSKGLGGFSSPLDEFSGPLGDK